MEFVLDPPYGIGPLRLGLTADEARTALAFLGPLPANPTGGLMIHRPSGLSLGVGFGAGPTSGRVNAIEAGRPDSPGDTVTFRNVNLFELPALTVVERLSEHARWTPDDDGFVANDLFLALWRPFAADDDPDEEEGYYFQSVLVARPGYNDTPAEAAARAAAGQPPGY
ncbi:hypothetical protein Aab01nite_38680 [Paractinoplanes abujensis]|uniref:Uncharacterized protein n=1 Tax=Paractinoplanes abujensis TaxID=882441 RepID=A0A7W7G3B7_9ACTN|nr:hypothetical protein [Actinoplanes abujensis]MBB4694509.1 hypothetical protein [Actinoplanes abujensis]GID20278.1 hypothetical protein Aab01nite_38680 [Actinoplanes abujensis]